MYQFVVTGLYANVRRKVLLVDVPELVERLAAAGMPTRPRLVAEVAIRELRAAGATGLIVARFGGVPTWDKPRH